MRKPLTVLILAAASLAPSALPAQGLEPAPAPLGVVLTATAPGRGIAESALELSATVQAIDVAARSITLRGAAGDVVTLPVGPEVESLEQIRAGDRVVIRYFQALALELKKHGTAKRERTERAVSEIARPGQRPAARDAQEVHIIADVIALDPKTQTVRLRGPTRVVDLRVNDPAQFALVEVGDQVEALYTEAVAVSVEPGVVRHEP